MSLKPRRNAAAPTATQTTPTTEARAPRKRRVKVKILCVDDEPHILHGLKLTLRKQYDVLTAASGAEGIDILDENPDIAVIMSDMRMPGMSGAEFLAAARDLRPDAVRLLLTGQADLTSTVAAINDGGVYRFLTKPSTPGVVKSAIADGCELYRLRRAEKELLHQTLTGSVSMLSDLLALAKPDVFGRALRIKVLVRNAARALALDDAWEFEIAATLCLVGCVVLPDEAASALVDGAPTSGHVRQLLADHPKTGERLLQAIPRLRNVAAMVGAQDAPLAPNLVSLPPQQLDRVVLGAHLLRVALDLDTLTQRGTRLSEALVHMEQVGAYNHKVLNTIVGIKGKRRRNGLMLCYQLKPGMTLTADVSTLRGVVVARAGVDVTDVLRERLTRFADGVGVHEPVPVLLPADD